MRDLLSAPFNILPLSGASPSSSFLDTLIQRLTTERRKGHLAESAPTTAEIDQLVKLAVESFLKQDTLLDIDPPIMIVGDIHGQFQDLLELLKAGGHPPKTRYLFLGDYIDRGSQSVEVLCLLLAYKVRYPKHMFLLRGNHESRSINRSYGFFHECDERYSVSTWHMCQKSFSAMPFCALIGRRIFCIHGGLPRRLNSFDEIRLVRRPVEVPDEGILCDLVWADPNKDTIGWEENQDRGVSYMFGEDAVDDFCQQFDLDLIVRAHQVFDEGFDVFANGRLITIFSAPNYTGTYMNNAAMLEVDRSLVCRIKVFQPQRERPRDDLASEEETGTRGPSAASSDMPSHVTLWMRRALNQMQQLLERENYSLYHPGQKDPPKRWWRTTMKSGQSHLSYRNSVGLTPVELSVIVNRDSPQVGLSFKAHLEGSATPVVYEMVHRPEYENQALHKLDEIVRKELDDQFVAKIIEIAKIAAPASNWGLRGTVNWFSSWLQTTSSDSLESTAPASGSPSQPTSSQSGTPSQPSSPRSGSSSPQRSSSPGAPGSK